MLKRVFIIHGWGGTPDEHWLPWVKSQLEAQGFAVVAPAMPDTDAPDIATWVGHLASIIGTPDEWTYFIGHSVGCQTILRYLETIAPARVGGCVFVAGWFRLENLESEAVEQIAAPWVRDDIDFSKVLSTTKNFTVINSSDDDYGAVAENKRLFEERLGSAVTIFEDRGHFTAGDGVTELPEVVAAIEQFGARELPPDKGD